MTTELEIGSYEREVLSALRQIGDTQRDQGEALDALASRVCGVDSRLVELNRQMTIALTGLSQRVVSLEGRVSSHDVQIGTLEGQSAALSARANAAEQRAASLSGRPIWVVAGAVSVGAVALLLNLILLILVLP